MHDIQQLYMQPKWKYRGNFATGSGGSNSFPGMKPVLYPIPTYGRVGDLLDRLGRSPWRPGYVYSAVSTPGYRLDTTHVFVDGNPYLKRDAVFGVEQTLMVPFRRRLEVR